MVHPPGQQRARRPVRRTFFLALLLIGGGLTVGTAIELALRYRENVDAVVTLQREVAEAAAFRIRQFIGEAESSMKVAARGRDAIALGLTSSFRFQLLNLLKARPEITAATAINRDGREVAKVSRFELVTDEDLGEHPLDRSFFSALAGRTFFGSLYYVRDSEPRMSIAVPIVWFGDAVEGVLEADVRLSHILDVVSAIRVGQRGYGYVVSDQGDLVAHPDLSLVLQKLNLGDRDQVRDALAGRTRSHGPLRNLLGERVIAANAPVNDVGWWVVVEQPIAEALSPALISVLRAAFLSLTALATALTVGLLISRRIVRPLTMLREGAARIGAGDFSARVEIESYDELEEVAGSFNDMASRLRELYAALEQRVDTRRRELREALRDPAPAIAPATPVASPTSRSETGPNPDPGAGPIDEATAILEELASNPGVGPQVLVALDIALCRAYLAGARPHDAMLAYERALTAARALGDQQLLFQPLHAITSARHWPQLLATRLDAGRQALRLAHHAAGSERQAAQLTLWHFTDLVEAGDMAGARAFADSSIADPEARGDGALRLVAHQMHLVLAMQVNVDRGIEKAIQDLRDVATEVDEQDGAELSDLPQFIIRREQGRIEELKPALEAHMAEADRAANWRPALVLLLCDLAQATEARVQFGRLAQRQFDGVPRNGRWVVSIVHLAEACAQLGEVAHAPKLYQLLLPYAGHNVVAPTACLGAADRYLGILSAARGDWAAAERHLEDALALHDNGLQPIWLAHTQFDLATALIGSRAENYHRRAAELLGKASATAESLNLVRLRENCLSVLSQKPGEAPLPHELTRAEVRVLRLVASGATNKAMGEKLFLSPHTVANHVRSILAKTSSANRMEAANYARRHGFVDDAPKLNDP